MQSGRAYKIGVLISSSVLMFLWLICFPLTIFLSIILFPLVLFGAFLYWGYWRCVFAKPIPIRWITFWWLSTISYLLSVVTCFVGFLQAQPFSGDWASECFFLFMLGITVIGFVCSATGIYYDRAK